MDSTDLIRKINRGDESILKEIYSSYRGEFLSWTAAQYGLDENAGLEIFQQSIVIMYDNIVTGKLNELTSSIKTYIFGIGRNKVREGLRKKRVATASISPEIVYYLQEESDDKMVIEERIFNMYTCLHNLGDPCKSILELYYFNRSSMEDIAVLMGYKNADTAKTRKFKCLNRLRVMMQNITEDV